MSDFNLDGVVPFTGPVTPVDVLPVAPIGPFVPEISFASATPNERREYRTINMHDLIEAFANFDRANFTGRPLTNENSSVTAMIAIAKD